MRNRIITFLGRVLYFMGHEERYASGNSAFVHPLLTYTRLEDGRWSAIGF